ncbi:unnamed protein product [Ixodes pacificus]
MVVAGSCEEGTFHVRGFLDEIFDSGWEVANKTTEDVILYTSHQDPQLLFIGGLRVDTSDQAQNILDETGDSLVCALGPHSKKVLGPLPSILLVNVRLSASLQAVHKVREVSRFSNQCLAVP